MAVNVSAVVSWHQTCAELKKGRLVYCQRAMPIRRKITVNSNMQHFMIYSQYGAGIVTKHDVTASASMAEFAYEHGKILPAAA